MIVTLLFTIASEGAVVIAYSFWRKKPLVPILLTSICANLITQSLLWAALYLFFESYLIALLSAELLIWMIESVLLYSVPANHLRLVDAILLNLGMNVASFVPGWFLPV